jgi:hypothetical protein
MDYLHWSKLPSVLIAEILNFGSTHRNKMSDTFDEIRLYGIKYILRKIRDIVQHSADNYDSVTTRRMTGSYHQIKRYGAIGELSYMLKMLSFDYGTRQLSRSLIKRYRGGLDRTALSLFWLDEYDTRSCQHADCDC